MKITKSQLKQLLEMSLQTPDRTANKVKEFMISQMLYAHDHGASMDYWTEEEMIDTINTEAGRVERMWTNRTLEREPKAFTMLFKKAKDEANQEIASAWDDDSLIEEDDEQMHNAMKAGKGKVDTKALMAKIGGKIPMSDEERAKSAKLEPRLFEEDFIDDDMVEVEADVWGGNSPRNHRQYVVFSVPKNEAENMTTRGFEDMAIEKFYKQDGYGDNPFCNSLIVDDMDVEKYVNLHKHKNVTEGKVDEAWDDSSLDEAPINTGHPFEKRADASSRHKEYLIGKIVGWARVSNDKTADKIMSIFQVDPGFDEPEHERYLSVIYNILRRNREI